MILPLQHAHCCRLLPIADANVAAGVSMIHLPEGASANASTCTLVEAAA